MVLRDGTSGCEMLLGAQGWAVEECLRPHGSPLCVCKEGFYPRPRNAVWTAEHSVLPWHFSHWLLMLIILNLSECIDFAIWTSQLPLCHFFFPKTGSWLIQNTVARKSRAFLSVPSSGTASLRAISIVSGFSPSPYIQKIVTLAQLEEIAGYIWSAPHKYQEF